MNSIDMQAAHMPATKPCRLGGLSVCCIDSYYLAGLEKWCPLQQRAFFKRLFLSLDYPPPPLGKVQVLREMYAPFSNTNPQLFSFISFSHSV